VETLKINVELKDWKIGMMGLNDLHFSFFATQSSSIPFFQSSCIA
jgi:hypothetical protein